MIDKSPKCLMEFQNITVKYGSHTALKDINLKIYEKDFLCIIGPNGSGKSTLLKTGAGIINSSEGKLIKAKGIKIGYMPQANPFLKSFPISVFNMVLQGRLPSKTTPFHRYSNLDKEIVKNYLCKLELENLKDKQIGELSGGQLQRALAARAICSNPDIILLDEPTSNADIKSSDILYSCLNDLNKKSAIVVVTHDIAKLSVNIKSFACINKVLHYHGSSSLTPDLLNKTFGCPVNLVSYTSNVKKEG